MCDAWSIASTRGITLSKLIVRSALLLLAPTARSFIAPNYREIGRNVKLQMRGIIQWNGFHPFRRFIRSHRPFVFSNLTSIGNPTLLIA